MHDGDGSLFHNIIILFGFALFGLLLLLLLLGCCCCHCGGLGVGVFLGGGGFFI